MIWTLLVGLIAVAFVLGYLLGSLAMFVCGLWLMWRAL